MKTILLSFSALAMVAAAPVAARDLVVIHKDLDLSTKKGQKTLERRIDDAARAYCGVDAQYTGTRVKMSGTAGCFKSARTAAREAMDGLVASSMKGG